MKNVAKQRHVTARPWCPIMPSAMSLTTPVMTSKSSRGDSRPSGTQRILCRGEAAPASASEQHEERGDERAVAECAGSASRAPGWRETR